MSPSALRSRVAASITSELGSNPRPWSESPHSYYAFPPQKDPTSVQPRSFAVGLGESATTQATERAGRQRRSVGAWTVTEVLVRFVGDLRADAQVTDLDTALDDEVDLVKAVMTTPGAGPPGGGLELRFLGITTREGLAGGTLFWAEARFAVKHAYPIS